MVAEVASCLEGAVQVIEYDFFGISRRGSCYHVDTLAVEELLGSHTHSPGDDQVYIPFASQRGRTPGSWGRSYIGDISNFFFIFIRLQNGEFFTMSKMCGEHFLSAGDSYFISQLL